MSCATAHTCDSAGRDWHFALVTASQSFLWEVLPFTLPHSREALCRFLNKAKMCNLPSPAVTAILVRTLAILDRQSAPRVPSLVDRYISNDASLESGIDAFVNCIDELLAFEAVGDPKVQRAMSIIRKNYYDPKCSPGSVATLIGVPLRRLCESFKRQTNRTLSEFLREVRLDRAATLLATTDVSVKEVWSSTGYNHASNFNHDFKLKFAFAPLDFRARAIQPLAADLSILKKEADVASEMLEALAEDVTVLIVEDDEDLLISIKTHLQKAGFKVFASVTAQSGIRQFDCSNVDVLLVDQHLGDMRGIDFIRAVRARSKGCPKIALFTADWNVTDLQQDLKDLCIDVLLKPFYFDDILRLVRKLSVRSLSTKTVCRADRPLIKSR